MFAIMASYPILDAVLIIPAVLILWGLRSEQRHSVPWICESTSLLCIAISDSWFAFIFLTHLVDQLWLDSIFFAAEYLIMAAGLFWYVRFVFPHHRKDWIGTLSAPSGGGTITLATSPTIGISLGKKGSGIAAVAIASVAIILVTALVIFPSYSPLSFASSSSRIIPDSAQRPASIIVGALLPLTGVMSSFGEAGYAALEMAVEDVNENFSKTNGKTVKVIVEDTETDPIIALEKLKKLDSTGVKIIVGPSTSAELDGVRQYADEKGILLISSSSTAPSLAIRGDNVFRFVSDDVYQAEAVARQMWNDGVRVVVPIWRSDSWGNDLIKFMRDDFEKLGGRVVDGVGYAPLTGESSASLSRINLIIWNQQLKALSSKVSQAIAHYGADKVGVHIAAFDEGS